MSNEPEIAFEDALKQIEQIVGDLERGEPELASALAKYEQGVRLLSHCYGLLDGAERTVALLSSVDEMGQPLTAPFDATSTLEREASSQASKTSPALPNPIDGIMDG